MTNKRTKTLVEMIVPIVLIGILVVVVTVYIAGEKTSTVTKASRATFLTPGDDVLSLEEDLKKLKTDPAAAEKSELNTIK